MTQILWIFVVALVAIQTPASAYDGRLYRPYAGPYRSYGFPYRDPRTDLEISRLRRDIREQRLHDGADRRRHEQEISLLRQQTMVSHQVSAQQACYYRSTGGFELCADLFSDDEAKRTQCDALVVQRNPSCNETPISDARERLSLP